MIDNVLPDNSFFTKLSHFENLYNRRYLDRQPIELFFLKNLFAKTNTSLVQVIGGHTCFDLFSTLDSQSEIINYDPFEGYFEKSQHQIDKEKYLFKKYWQFKGKYTHKRKHIKKLEDIKNCNNSVLMISNDTFFPTFRTNKKPSLLIYSHYRDLTVIDPLITKYIPKIHPLLPLRAVSFSMMYFSENTVSDCLPDSIKTYVTDGSFGGCEDVKFINDVKPEKYQNFSNFLHQKNTGKI